MYNIWTFLCDLSSNIQIELWMSLVKTNQQKKIDLFVTAAVWILIHTSCILFEKMNWLDFVVHLFVFFFLFINHFKNQ